MKLKEKQLSTKKMYECFFMKLYEDEVLLPNGEKSTRIYIKHDGASAVLPITINNTVLLIKQFRYPIGVVSLEIPAGKKDEPGEDGLLCAKRELEEETGHQSNNIKKIMDLHNCVGYSDEKIEMFIAYDCDRVENPLDMDEDEFIELVECTINDVKQYLKNGEITDAKTIVALQHYLLEVE